MKCIRTRCVAAILLLHCSPPFTGIQGQQQSSNPVKEAPAGSEEIDPEVYTVAWQLYCTFRPSEQLVLAQKLKSLRGWNLWFEDRLRELIPAARGNPKADELLNRFLTAHPGTEVLRELDRAELVLPRKVVYAARQEIIGLCSTLEEVGDVKSVRTMGYLLMENAPTYVHVTEGVNTISTQEIAYRYLVGIGRRMKIESKMPPATADLSVWKGWWVAHCRDYGADSPYLPGLETGTATPASEPPIQPASPPPAPTPIEKKYPEIPKPGSQFGAE